MDPRQVIFPRGKQSTLLDLRRCLTIIRPAGRADREQGAARCVHCCRYVLFDADSLSFRCQPVSQSHLQSPKRSISALPVQVSERRVREICGILACQRLTVLKIADKYPPFVSLSNSELSQRLVVIKVIGRFLSKVKPRSGLALAAHI